MAKEKADRGDPRTRAQRNREIRQQTVREMLSAQKLVAQLLADAEKLQNVEPAKVPGIKAAADIRKALLAKVLPDLKSVDHSSKDGTMTPPTRIRIEAATVVDGNDSAAS